MQLTQTTFNVAADITPSDTVDLVCPGSTRSITDAIYVGGAGIVACVLENGAVVNFTAAVGTTLPVAARRVNAANTTATLLKALWQR